MNRDEKIMARCIELAGKGAGYVSPNPMVGCVIVKDGKVAAEGYHKEFGKAHAEAAAISNAHKKGIDIKGMEMYVNLEPCVHHGKTPPCVDEIIRSKVGKVIVGTKDPNSLVNGGGIKKLKENGIEVAEGVLEGKCIELNRFFFKYMRTGLPYVTLKAAESLDGKIADANNRSKWISSLESRKLVHKLRGEYDAVLVGRRTVEYDNPSLTVRLVKGRNPYRIVIDKNLRLGLNKKLFRDKFRYKTIVLTSVNSKKKKFKDLSEMGVKPVFCKTNAGKINLRDSLKNLGKMGIASILVEGGAETYSEFLKQNLADELLIFIAPKIIGKGVDIFDVNKNIDFSDSSDISYRLTGKDLLVRIRINN